MLKNILLIIQKTLIFEEGVHFQFFSKNKHRFHSTNSELKNYLIFAKICLYFVNENSIADSIFALLFTKK
jgi:hypothetical protein